MSSKTFKVRKVAIAGGGGSASAWAEKLAMWLSIDVLEAIIETGVGNKYLLSIQWVFSSAIGWNTWRLGILLPQKGPKSCCFLVKSQFFHVFVVWTSDFAPYLYSKIVLFIDFALLKRLLTFFNTYLVFILCACRMGHLLGPKQKTGFLCRVLWAKLSKENTPCNGI